LHAKQGIVKPQVFSHHGTPEGLLQLDVVCVSAATPDQRIIVIANAL
jgi:hypothetical protein